MSETHRTDYEDFDLEVTVGDDGMVGVRFIHPDGEHSIPMEFDTFRDVLEFVSKHGLAMDEPMLVEFRDTREALEA